MRAVLLIHGFMTDSNDFSKILPLLHVKYDEVCCPNLPFHSASEKKTSIKAQVILEFVQNVFDELAQRNKTVDVVGFSMGGALAVHLSKTKNINRLILLAPANKYISASYAYYTAEYFFKKAKLKKATDKCISNLEDVKKDNADAVKMFFKQLLPKYTLKNLTEFSKLMFMCNKGIKQINCPVLILWGRLDQLVPIGSSTFLLKKCTNPTKLRIIYRDISHYMLYSRAYAYILHDILLFLTLTNPPALNAPNNTKNDCNQV